MSLLFVLFASSKVDGLEWIVWPFAVAYYCFIYSCVVITLYISPLSVIAERYNTTRAMKRAWDLTSGKFSYVLCTILSLGLAKTCVEVVVKFFAGKLAALVLFFWGAATMPLGAM